MLYAPNWCEDLRMMINIILLTVTSGLEPATLASLLKVYCCNYADVDDHYTFKDALKNYVVIL